MPDSLADGEFRLTDPELRVAMTHAYGQDSLADPSPRPWDSHDDPRMSAYYYTFQPTGNAAIDWVLHAVAVAGKGAHHTDCWTDDGNESYIEGHGLRGKTYAEAIQNAAVDATSAVTADRDALAAQVEAVKALCDNANMGKVLDENMNPLYAQLMVTVEDVLRALEGES